VRPVRERLHLRQVRVHVLGRRQVRPLPSSLSLSLFLSSFFFVERALLTTPPSSASLARRSVLSGSYNNYFHIYDTAGTQDIVLQADKSAFKAKKLGGKGNNAKGGAGGAGAGKNGAGGAGGAGAAGSKKPLVDTDNIDFNKKILHASWHPRENTVRSLSLPRPPSLVLRPRS